jgi:ABC-type branched-subunit amino acid transport system ATPase component
VFLAVATLGLAIFIGNVVFPTSWMFGIHASGVKTPQPHVSVAGLSLDSTRGFYYLVILFALVATLIVVAIEHGRMGRLLRALGDSPTVLEVQGLNVNVIRTVVFCISAAMAAVAGVLIGAQFQYALGDQFQWFNSIQVVALVLILVGGTPWYALFAAAAAGLTTGYITSPNVGNYLSIAFGVGAIGYVYGIHKGRVAQVPPKVRHFLVNLDRRLAAISPRKAIPQPEVAVAPAEGVPSTTELQPAIATGAIAARDHRSGEGLEVRGVTVDFGGVRALKEVSLRAPAGRITGLIGPNGAGKTTLFNSCSGLLRPTSGHVLFDGKDITHLTRPRRAQLGLGRTFQRPLLFDSLTVRENVATGREAGLAASSPLHQLIGTKGDEVDIRQAVAEAMSLTGIEDLADRQAALLSTGQRRLVELARVLAGSFSVIMLDEPGAGLDSEETHRLGEILRQVVVRRGVGILIVEHDLSLVRQVCERIYVLDFGQLIFEGTPEEMLQSDLVKVAYLGEELEHGLADETKDAIRRA